MSSSSSDETKHMYLLILFFSFCAWAQHGEKSVYELILDEERRSEDTTMGWHQTTAGAVALLGGIYGYYRDDRVVAAKLAYTLMQSAGLALIGNSITRSYQPHFRLSLDRQFKKTGNLNYDQYRQLVVDDTRQQKIADLRERAFTTGVTGVLYGVNGILEKDKTIQGVFYFLSGCLVLTSAVSTYKYLKLGRNTEETAWHFGIFPGPYVSYVF